MKRLTLLAMCALAAITFVGCSGGDSKEDAKQNSDVVKATPENPGPGDTAAPGGGPAQPDSGGGAGEPSTATSDP